MPPWKPGQTGNKKGFNGSRAEKEILRYLKKENLWPEFAKTVVAKSIGPHADARWAAIFARLLRQWPEQRKAEVDTVDLDYSDDKAIFMTKRMMEADAEYERKQRDSLSPPHVQRPGIDQEENGGGDPPAG